MEYLDILLDSVIDCAKLIPFLFATYLVMEYLEHKTGEKTKLLIGRMGGNSRERFGGLHTGPVVGSLLGMVPQCGFSAAASNLYAGRVITLGTLLAVYLSTSDEMLPILISERAPVDMILRILLAKVLVGMAAGLVVDLLSKPKDMDGRHIHDICEQENCHCEKGIFRSAILHTIQIAFFIFIISFALNLVLHFVGENVLRNMLLGSPVLGAVLAGIVGLIPNCAGSVVLTQLYLQGAMGVGAMMSGLLANSGVGLLVLFRVNHHKKENLKILVLLYGIGVLIGIILGLVPVMEQIF